MDRARTRPSRRSTSSHDNVGEVRWLDDRLLMSDRDAILERLERALWAAYEVDPQRDENVKVPSPLRISRR
jgi:hypothetical protein